MKCFQFLLIELYLLWVGIVFFILLSKATYYNFYFLASQFIYSRIITFISVTVWASANWLRSLLEKYSSDRLLQRSWISPIMEFLYMILIHINYYPASILYEIRTISIVFMFSSFSNTSFNLCVSSTVTVALIISVMLNGLLISFISSHILLRLLLILPWTSYYHDSEKFSCIVVWKDQLYCRENWYKNTA